MVCVRERGRRSRKERERERVIYDDGEGDCLIVVLRGVSRRSGTQFLIWQQRGRRGGHLQVVVLTDTWLPIVFEADANYVGELGPGEGPRADCVDDAEQHLHRDNRVSHERELKQSATSKSREVDFPQHPKGT